MLTCFNIRDHGAVGDGVTNDAVAIQAAIDACHAGGGGTVLVPAGATYLSGSLVLKSFVDLHVERGAVLQASGDWADITERRVVTALSSGVVRADTPESGQFLAAYGATQVSVSGAGTIDGAGRHYVLEDLGPIYRMPVERPFTVFFIDCTRVSLRDVTIVDPALWTIRLTGCSDVLVHGITIDGDMRLPNGDGLDLDHCRDVRVSDCRISCSDDAISLKTCEEFPDAGPCENITVTGCVLTSRSSALVVGVDSCDTIRDVVFTSCVVRSSHRGLSVNLGQAARYENILFSDIVVETELFDDRWWGRGEPIYVSAMPWHDEIGTVGNVRFRNILARGENGVHIEALHPGLISGVVLEDVRVELRAPRTERGGRYDRRPYTSGQEIYDHPTNGFHLVNADDVTLRNCEVVFAGQPQKHWGHALEAVGCRDLVVDNLRGESAFPDRLPAIRRA